MNTTDLFVELIVIGIGGTIWVLLFALSFLGYDWVPPEQLFSLVALVPFLSTAYVLGIVIDRVTDAIFEKWWSKNLLKKIYKDDSTYLNDRRLIYIHSGRLADLLEYGRSRLRICRGWSLNALLILISSNVFIWTRIPNESLKINLSIFCSIFMLLFTLGCGFSWQQLMFEYYRKVKTQSEFLRKTDKTQNKVGKG